MKDIVSQYYKLVDENKIEELLDLFSDDIVYNRCGKELIGKEELRTFYFTTRTLSGVHHIEKIISDEEESVIVVGKFIGKSKEIEKLEIEFADIFYIENNKINQRKTYLQTGYEHIK